MYVAQWFFGLTAIAHTKALILTPLSLLPLAMYERHFTLVERNLLCALVRTEKEKKTAQKAQHNHSNYLNLHNFIGWRVYTVYIQHGDHFTNSHTIYIHLEITPPCFRLPHSTFCMAGANALCPHSSLSLFALRLVFTPSLSVPPNFRLVIFIGHIEIHHIQRVFGISSQFGPNIFDR